MLGCPFFASIASAMGCRWQRAALVRSDRQWPWPFAGDDLMRCVDLYNQAQSKWFEEMVTTTLVSDRRYGSMCQKGVGTQEAVGGCWWT